MDQEVDALHKKRAIVPVSRSQEGFISPVFLVPKADALWRTVINLRALNRFVAASHFKMESIRTVKGLIREGDWMAKLGLPVHPQYQKLVYLGWSTNIQIGIP